MSRSKNPRKRKLPQVILVKDLAPRRDVKGGSGKILFGERFPENGSERIRKGTEWAEEDAAECGRDPTGEEDVERDET